MSQIVIDTQILDIIIKWATPLILTAVIAFMKKTLKDSKSMKQSMVILLRSQIVSKVEHYMKLGYLPDYARSCLEELFNQYTILGGNHGVGELVQKCFQLPPIDKKEKGGIDDE